ncbi:hypothetical protein [Streptomyces fungicidicus]|uniref:hypothetical protein n=1 Tax=Streptomyces fungicidicus TaxID=68203 RepID=UPI003D7190FB
MIAFSNAFDFVPFFVPTLALRSGTGGTPPEPKPIDPRTGKSRPSLPPVSIILLTLMIVLGIYFGPSIVSLSELFAFSNPSDFVGFFVPTLALRSGTGGTPPEPKPIDPRTGKSRPSLPPVSIILLTLMIVLGIYFAPSIVNLSELFAFSNVSDFVGFFAPTLALRSGNANGSGSGNANGSGSNTGSVSGQTTSIDGITDADHARYNQLLPLYYRGDNLSKDNFSFMYEYLVKQDIHDRRVMDDPNTTAELRLIKRHLIMGRTDTKLIIFNKATRLYPDFSVTRSPYHYFFVFIGPILE